MDYAQRLSLDDGVALDGFRYYLNVAIDHIRKAWIRYLFSNNGSLLQFPSSCEHWDGFFNEPEKIQPN